MENCCSTRTRQLAVLGLCTVAAAGCLYVIRKNYLQQVADYRKQMASLDPARVAEWKCCRSYQRICEEIRADYERINTVTREVPKCICQGPEGPIFQNCTETVWIENITPEAFVVQVRNNAAQMERLQKACDKMGTTVDEAFAEILANEICSAGSKPGPARPSFNRAALKGAGTTALFATLALAHWQFQARRAA